MIKNTYNLGGKFAVSNRFGFLPDGSTQTGFSHELHFGKTSGQFNFNISQERTDTKFSSDDMGYFTNNNYLNHYMWVGYHWNKPTNWYNRININFNSNLSLLSQKIQPINETYQSAGFNINGNMQTKKLWYAGVFFAYNFRQNDFYEPRATGWYFKRGAEIITESWVESNSSKKYSFSLDVVMRHSIQFYNQHSVSAYIYQNFRVNNKLNFFSSNKLIATV